jgi:mannose-6-phosphate isomerase-like protein (cupin superfamily)
MPEVHKPGGKPMSKLWLVVLITTTAMAGCERNKARLQAQTEPAYYTRIDGMETMPAGEGEVIHLLRGEARGFEGLSFILTETGAGGGPPLHTHESEEAHVLQQGTVGYIIGDKRFDVAAPYVVRIPAGVPHTFINRSTGPVQLIGVFASKQYSFKEVGPNPLQ